MAETALRTAIDFLQDFGFFDVILPFLLVFTIIFAILEKTKILGSEEIDGKRYAKKNIDSMVAFSIAFFVVATKEVVQSLQVSLPNVALILIMVICFLMLAGSFMGDKEFSFEDRTGWKIFLTLVMFICVLLIFLNSLGWLNPITDYVAENLGEVMVPTVLIAVVLGTIFFIVGGKGKSKDKEES